MLFEKAREFCISSGIYGILKSSSYVIVGFSGGADSSVLLSFLSELKNELGGLNIVAAHVNHMIRGNEADSDQSFCEDVCRKKGIILEIEKRDIPAVAKENSEGLEEAARNVRYSFFERLLGKYPNSVVATAHNADDNLETVIFNMARGCGTKGLSGIAPVRDKKIIRPLLSLSSEEIRGYAKVQNIAYVTDSTNADTAYTRNSIRHSIVPILRSINPKAGDAALRLSRAAREDCEYIESEARRITEGRELTRELLLSLHPALFQRVLRDLYKKEAGSACDLSEKNIFDCRRLLENREGKCVSLPGGIAFFADQNRVRMGTDPRYSVKAVMEEIRLLPESFAEFGDFLIFCTEKSDYVNIIEENIYKLSLHTVVDYDKICGNLFVRTRREGDTFRIRKVNRKLKKLLCDCKIPACERETLPVITDGEGIVCVPFVGLRDGCMETAETERKLNLHIYKRR